MKVHCAECDSIFCETTIISGEEDGFGKRGICPICGSDEEEFSNIDEINIAHTLNGEKNERIRNKNGHMRSASLC